jgi:CubicO group peptidase (beta-lactamase class C family)
VPVHWTGHVLAFQDDSGLRMVPYHIEEIHNLPWHVAKVEPGGGMRGPARELGRFYESLLGFGPPILEPRTVEVMGAVHRYGIPDVIFGGQKTPWGLGVQVASGMSGGLGRRAFGHGGMASSRGIADPDDVGRLQAQDSDLTARPGKSFDGEAGPTGNMPGGGMVATAPFSYID